MKHYRQILGTAFSLGNTDAILAHPSLRNTNIFPIDIDFCLLYTGEDPPDGIGKLKTFSNAINPKGIPRG